MHQAERSFVKLGLAEGGHGPFRGLDAPFALLPKYASGFAKVNRVRHIQRANVPEMIRPFSSVSASSRVSFKRSRNAAIAGETHLSLCHKM
jgi:hypothetical protein